MERRTWERALSESDDDIGAPRTATPKTWRNTGITAREYEQQQLEAQVQRARVIAELDAADAADRMRIEARRAERERAPR